MRKVPFMPTEHIEAASLCLLAEHGRKHAEVVAPPVPAEEILQSHLGLHFDFDDLPGLVGVPDVLGATSIQDRRVLVDQSLDPEENPTREGRYRFTVAHEVGHGERHRRFFLEDAAQPSLFGEKKAPSIVWRTRSWKETMEWQAGSGLSVRAYCRTHRLGESTFYSWRRALARGRAGGRPGALVPVTVAGERTGPGRPRGLAADGAGGARIEILLANGRRVQVWGPVDRRAPAGVLAVVEGRPC